jgi:hypothetical protein
MFASTHAAPISFQARSAIAAFHIDRNLDRLRASIPVADLSARDAQGRTLVDIYEQRQDARAVAALRSIGAHRSGRH